MDEDAVKKLLSNLKQTGVTKGDFDFVKYVVFAMLFVLLLAFLGILMNAWAERKSVFVEMKDQIVEQNIRIQVLTESVNQSKGLKYQKHISE